MLAEVTSWPGTTSRQELASCAADAAAATPFRQLQDSSAQLCTSRSWQELLHPPITRIKHLKLPLLLLQATPPGHPNAKQIPLAAPGLFSASGRLWLVNTCRNLQYCNSFPAGCSHCFCCAGSQLRDGLFCDHRGSPAHPPWLFLAHRALTATRTPALQNIIDTAQYPLSCYLSRS